MVDFILVYFFILLTSEYYRRGLILSIRIFFKKTFCFFLNNHYK